MKKVLFVCLGNICRSPVAEGIFKSKIRSAGITDQFYADSAGTADYHVGNPPHATSTKVAKENGVILNHFGRQFTSADFNRFDFIVCMDESNYTNVVALAASEDEKKKIYLMRQWEVSSDPENLKTAGSVPDPYGGSIDGFMRVHQLLNQCNDNLLQYLQTVPVEK